MRSSGIDGLAVAVFPAAPLCPVAPVLPAGPIGPAGPGGPAIPRSPRGACFLFAIMTTPCAPTTDIVASRDHMAGAFHHEFRAPNCLCRILSYLRGSFQEPEVVTRDVGGLIHPSHSGPN